MGEPLELSSESSYVGQTIDERYHIQRLVGRGGMGAVYLVEHIHMKKTMAMKLLHEDMVVRKQLVSRFTREARAISRLHNDHTVRVYDFGRYEALFFLVMEYLDGEDLEVILSREGALPWRRALKIMDQVCDALTEAHAAGIIHRDLKPENIMRLHEPRDRDFVKVLDFGLAKINNMDDVFSVHSHRDLFGTPFYMSPEQIRAEDLDHRADIYSLGCLCFRLLTNQYVYDAPYAFDVLRQHLTSPIPSAGRVRPDMGIPARVDRLVWRALAKRPENRFQNTEAMRAEIAGCLADPDGASITLPSAVPEPERAVELDEQLKARLRAFEASHREAEARMVGGEPPDLPDDFADLPMGAVLEEPAAPAPPPPVMREPRPSVDSSELLFHEDNPDNVATMVDRIPVQPDPADLSDLDLSSSARKPSRPMIRRPSQPLKKADLQQLDEDAELDPDDSLLEGGYASRLKAQRRARLVAAAFLLAVALGGGYWWLKRGASGAGGDAEQEPNNQVTDATPLEAGQTLSGYLGKALSTFEPDRDMYRLKTGGAGRYVSLEVTAVSNLDLFVEFLEPGGRRLGRVDVDGLGKPEAVHRFRVPGEEVILVVSEAKAGDAKPTENSSEPYTITAKVMDSPDGEGDVEPNNDLASANRYVVGQAVTGYLDGPRDADFYEVSVDPKLGLRRWEVVVEVDASLVPRLTLFRVDGGSPRAIFADEGRKGLLRTVFEEPGTSAATYVLAVQHAGRGTPRGRYRLVADLKEARSRVAQEPNDDRARAANLAIGQEVHGLIDGLEDVDVFAIPVTDPNHRQIEVVMDPMTRQKVRITIDDLPKANRLEIPRRAPKGNALPQPRLWDEAPIRFEGQGETYYLTVRSREKSPEVSYSLRVMRLMDGPGGKPVGGPGY